ncbi:sensor histidine kinase [Merismopedia glauca]|uniref:histidine kinase n=1 Tax=Merismopedia glauca CCAP 1448/3 TaxID=1296344 RepID=A0A2T1C0H1_9CYAN|nr:HAMP domain-containing sensor histidine kinase [Merismopedia glauca]PSB01766.1 two-component sensor histidine kinase [Merismopedia glauca CCAP 1448/3]
MFQATRRRLAIWYTTITAVVLLLFATGVYMYVRNTLVERVDDTLNHVVEVMKRSLAVEPARNPKNGWKINVEASFRDNANSQDDDRIDIEWFSPTGELLWSTLSQPLAIPIHPNSTGETVRIPAPDAINDESSLFLRQVTERVEIGRQVLGYLRVSHPWFEVTKPSRELIVDLTFGTLAMVGSVAAIGWFLSGIAIEPVKESYQRLKQFTSDASHELRSPIAIIQTNVQVALAESDSLEPWQQQQLQVIERLTRRLGKLVDDLLFLARQDSGIVQPAVAPVPLDALLMETIEEQQLAAKTKDISIHLEIVDPDKPASEDDFTIPGDWDRLARLFTNLISNAIAYTPKATPPLVKCPILVELQRLGSPNYEYLQVKVKDRGIGIPQDAIPHLFDRFYRVDPARKRSQDPAQIVESPSLRRENTGGSGLGLAIAAAIVASYQGQIQIDSQLHQGTTVTVTLPVNQR